MLDKIKTALEKSQQSLGVILDNVEDQYEDWSEGTAVLWGNVRPKLQQLQDSLKLAASSIQIETDEARLQAHLATMDACDQWTYLRATVTEVARHAQKKGKTELQHADLQAHLAKMDARDFMNKQGQEITRNYKSAQATIERASHKAVQELEHNLETIGSAWVHTRY